jgi:hypothetical protein
MNQLLADTTLSKQKIIQEFKTFLRFPTIGSDSTKNKALQDCASWLRYHLKSIGLPKVHIYQTKKHPSFMQDIYILLIDVLFMVIMMYSLLNPLISRFPHLVQKLTGVYLQGCL